MRQSHGPEIGLQKDPNVQPLAEIDDYAGRLVRHWARRLVRELRLPSTDLPDLEQEFWLDLVARWPRYDAERSSPKTFAARLVERRAATLRRKFGRSACRCMRQLPGDPRDAACDDGAAGCDGRSEQEGGAAHGTLGPAVRESDPDLADDVATVVARLPDSLREVCRRLMANDISEVARQMRVSRAAIYRRINVARAHFAAADIHEYL